MPETRLKAARLELKRGLDGLLNKSITVSGTPDEITANGAVIVGTQA